MTDEAYMQMAIDLAWKGVGKVNPNPLVGAILVKQDHIIGQGYHEKCGELHAERNALADCREDPEGSTLYVTLEPCCHYGRTPPCTEAIIESKIARVVIGHLDPNPLVAGKGVQMLQEAGIDVVVDVLGKQCEQQNEVFFSYIREKMPFVVMKYAMTLDGKIATASGQSRWITGEKAREKVHQDRNQYMGIMVGIGTVLKDDPELSCRIPGGRNPIRIICDTKLRTPLDSRIVKTAKTCRTILITACREKCRQIPFLEAGCEILEVEQEETGINLKEAMQKLGQIGIDGIYLEGGGTLNDSAIRAGIVNKIQAYIAPKILGGKEAKTPVEGTGILQLTDCLQLENLKLNKLGEDFLIEGDVKGVYRNH